MPKFYDIEPEVAGRVGARTVYDRTTHPPRLSNLEYEFDDWRGDAILASFPCYIVTSALATSLRRNRLTGFNLDEVLVSKSPEFDDLCGKGLKADLPSFEWLQLPHASRRKHAAKVSGH